MVKFGGLPWQRQGGQGQATVVRSLSLGANPFDESQISTVLMAVITSNLALAQTPGNVRISNTDSGLPKASVLNVSQLITIDRQYLVGRVGKMPGRVMERVDEGLKLVLSL